MDKNIVTKFFCDSMKMKICGLWKKLKMDDKDKISKCPIK